MAPTGFFSVNQTWSRRNKLAAQEGGVVRGKSRLCVLRIDPRVVKDADHLPHKRRASLQLIRRSQYTRPLSGLVHRGQHPKQTSCALRLIRQAEWAVTSRRHEDEIGLMMFLKERLHREDNIPVRPGLADRSVGLFLRHFDLYALDSYVGVPQEHVYP